MKKILAFILCMMMAAGCVSALADGEPKVPETLKELGTLPEANVSEFAEISTYTDSHTVTVKLSKPVDSIKANWLGKNEVPEELTVGSDLTAQFSRDGHKYSVGTKWVDGKHPVSNAYISFFAVESNDELAKATAQAKGTEVTDEAKEWAAEINKGYDDKVETVIEVEKVQWHVYVEKDGEYDELTFPADYSEKEIEKLIEKGGYDYAAYGKYGYAAKVIRAHKFKPSNGSPNYAYLTRQGDAMVVYGRGGNIRYFERIVEGSNYFGMGTGRASVRFESHDGYWYISNVTEEYESGDIQAVSATYRRNGTLKKTDIQKREAE